MNSWEKLRIGKDHLVISRNINLDHGENLHCKFQESKHIFLHLYTVGDFPAWFHYQRGSGGKSPWILGSDHAATLDLDEGN